MQNAGCLEGAEQEKEKAVAERQQFNEDDQTNLYMAAHNLKTQNKKGLGTKSHIGNNARASVGLQYSTMHDSHSPTCINTVTVTC